MPVLDVRRQTTSGGRFDRGRSAAGTDFHPIRRCSDAHKTRRYDAVSGQPPGSRAREGSARAQTPPGRLTALPTPPANGTPDPRRQSGGNKPRLHYAHNILARLPCHPASSTTMVYSDCYVNLQIIGLSCQLFSTGLCAGRFRRGKGIAGRRKCLQPYTLHPRGSAQSNPIQIRRLEPRNYAAGSIRQQRRMALATRHFTIK